ncbi:MAG: hypothetical protein K1060chlam5_01164 [Candidatus Anoxychlamydiales bacterium]|nr:hypothetical protein [Candidatus Anoxychlamydiales bacterium]
MKDKISNILKQANIPFENFSFLSLEGGANNRVYKITLDNDKAFILKHYFHHKNDLRKRLISEFCFSTFAWNNNIRCIPKPIFSLEKENLGLFSYVPGRLANNNDLNENTIQKAVNFIIDLNKNKDKASNLPKASEACFSINDHLNLVEKRIKNLTLISEISQHHKTALDFVNNKLMPKWEKLKQPIYSNDTISVEDMCVSPSDFGLHNVIIDNKNIYFIDFEYAGWDDPAKIVCDFFCQPKISIPLSYFEKFAKDIASITSNSKKCLERINILFPVYQIKWCSIILNIFLKTEKTRRLFSKTQQDSKKQLDLAKSFLEKIKT